MELSKFWSFTSTVVSAKSSWPTDINEFMFGGLTLSLSSAKELEDFLEIAYYPSLNEFDFFNLLLN
jgi:hypothetical protein